MPDPLPDNSIDPDRVIEKFADAVAAIPADEPLMEGLIRRAKTSGLEHIVSKPVPGNALYDAAVAELARRAATSRKQEP